MRPPLPNRPSQSNSASSSPRPGYAQPVQSSQLPMNIPYIASNIGQASQGMNGYAAAQSQNPGSQPGSNLVVVQDPMSQQRPQSPYSSIQSNSQSTVVGQGPPQPGTRRRNSPQSAPRLYHRMMLELEVTKQAFFAAKSRRTASFHHKSFEAPTNNNTEHILQEMASAAYEVESSSRRLWALRYEHSWEFDGYSEATNQAVFSKWQAEYEMWADTVLDIQDGQILAEAANPSKYGISSMHRGSEDWDSQSRQARLGFQEPNGENRHHASSIPGEQLPPQVSQQMPPQQPMPQLQSLSMGYPVPTTHTIANSQTPQQMPPGAYPRSGPPNDPNTPPQQLSQRPQPPPITPTVQTPPLSIQSEPNTQPTHFNAPPTTHNHPNAPVPNTQQPETLRPGQMPNQQPNLSVPAEQYVPQNPGMPSGSAPNLMPQQQHQNMGTNQQRPPQNRIPQGSNTGPRQYPSPLPGAQIPPGLQAGRGGGGGQMQMQMRGDGNSNGNGNGNGTGR